METMASSMNVAPEQLRTLLQSNMARALLAGKPVPEEDTPRSDLCSDLRFVDHEGHTIAQDPWGASYEGYNPHPTVSVALIFEPHTHSMTTLILNFDTSITAINGISC